MQGQKETGFGKDVYEDKMERSGGRWNIDQPKTEFFASELLKEDL